MGLSALSGHLGPYMVFAELMCILDLIWAS